MRANPLVPILSLLLVSTAQAQPSAPVVVELFQSQGCSSCPPANANVNILASRPGVLALNFSVDYWDDLGWKDTFARPSYTQRQWAYARGLGRRNVATPQVVINGRTDIVGIDRSSLDRAVQAASHPDAVTLTERSATIGAGKADKPADVWLVRYDPRVRNVAIKRGENNGKTLPHRNIVTDLVRLGAWTGQPATYAFAPSADPALKTAVLVQSPGGPILAAGVL